MKRSTKERNIGRGRAIVFAVLLILLAALLLLRILRTRPGEAPAEETPVPTDAPVQTMLPKPEEAETSVTEPTEAEPTLPDEAEEKLTPQATPTPVNTKAPVPTGAGGYNKTTYEIVSDMVYTYRQLQSEGMDTVRRDLEKLKAADPALGTAWERIMETWVYVNNDLEIFDSIPAGLPEDDSLAIVTLGFQLLPDGSMDPELVSRCELAMSCAETYPNAYVIVTGGGTALDNKEMTEAQAMADWFIREGLDQERLIVETRAMTTGQNAQYSCEILMAEYPQVNNLLLVTSDYHMQMAWLLFSEEAYLYECAYGVAPYVLAANASVHIPEATDEYNGTSKQAQYLWTLADPQY